MNEITLCAYAKINLHLEVTGVLENGYHTIESIMHSVSLADVLSIKKTDFGVLLRCTDPTLSCAEDNLAVRAAYAFFSKTHIPGGAEIKLIKRIPMQAGLGGGSSDAAATLRGLNLLYGSPCTDQTLYAIGEALGADVPFCLRARSAIATGIGTTLGDAPSLPPCRFLICIGNRDKMSTKDAYAALDRMHYQPLPFDSLLLALQEGNLDAIGKHLFNRFSSLNPTAEHGMARLRALGAKAALLCGSGASFFGLYAPEDTACIREAAVQMEKEGYLTWIADPIG